MKKIGICGNFSHGTEAIGGQTIRTRIVAEELKEKYGKKEIVEIDTNQWKKKPLSLLFSCILLLIKCENIIILPAHNGIKVFIPLFVSMNAIFRRKIHYIVIGAWLADDLNENKWLIKFTKRINYIYVQTETLKEKLKHLSICGNTILFPNFKKIHPLGLEELRINNCIPYKICTLSRINYLKGIEEAIDVISKLHKDNNKTYFKLDVYGPIEEDYRERFTNVVSEHSNFVSYKGVVEYSNTIDVLKEYDLLVFPTKYYTEGFPGTIIDAFFSGVPVVASRWESYNDIIDENITGITYEFDNKDDFYCKLEYIIKNPNIIMKMKKNCIEESEKYSTDRVIEIIANNIA